MEFIFLCSVEGMFAETWQLYGDYIKSIVYCIRDKHRWETKVHDEKIVAKWKKEAEKQNIAQDFDCAIEME